MSSTVEMTVPDLIWRQITTQTKMACGAKEPFGSKKTLQFQVRINLNQRHKIQVTLEASDTYTVKLYHIRGANVSLKEERLNVYVDDLNETIYRMCNK
jgi:hypothetical protein